MGSQPHSAVSLQGAEHRRAPRSDVVAQGLLLHGRALEGVRCTVRDVSATGARVKLKAAEFLSQPLYLVIDKTGAAFHAEIAWARGGELGLALKGRLNLAEQHGELERRVYHRWKEMPA